MNETKELNKRYISGAYPASYLSQQQIFPEGSQVGHQPELWEHDADDVLAGLAEGVARHLQQWVVHLTGEQACWVGLLWWSKSFSGI